MLPLIIFLLGCLTGIGACALFLKLRSQDKSTIEEQMKNTFSGLSLDALAKNTEHFLKVAQENLSKQSELQGKELHNKKTLIDQTLVNIKKEMDQVKLTIQNVEKDREKKFGELSNYLKTSTEQTTMLRETTAQLKEALASSKTRGQWGERMAEDILRLSGLIEGVNYSKQKSQEFSRSIPDFTFFLPNQLRVNMDVKFPLNNYIKYLNTSVPTEQENYKQQFLRDVKQRIKDVTSKDYINPEHNTVDYVLVFIPNEQIYGFINEHDQTLIDEALKQKVIFCSPLTLYALLAVIRQAIDNFTMEKTASEMLSLIGSFNKQWKKFNESLDKMGKRINDAQQEFHILTTTRKTQLERPLQKIEALREDQKIELIESAE